MEILGVSGSLLRGNQHSPQKKVDCALALVACERPMTSVCSVQGVSRSILHVRHHRSGHWQDSRRSRTPTPDELLLADLRRHIAEAIAAAVRCSIERGDRKGNRRRTKSAHPLGHGAASTGVGQRAQAAAFEPHSRWSSQCADEQHAQVL
ncbi:hypothetical protein ACFSW6_13590 [Comamonas terrae]|uniref:Transposase n=1 Tax=Comamonas terrae TaxID=673548 RepID=A0ABW5UNB1_9BURK